ncbi:alpha/beta fold hydrolase [Candidatus Poriferisodalis sp.]|uniref:alpha/beta fold hydrolase n=1 Tax=Candidatus Poriferisodalis sp. TaxID=3101277 RepID=UPI003B0250A8
MTGGAVAGSRPDWVSDTMFPFESKFHRTSSGHQMHYVDEGSGEPIVFVHGNPAWSFEFRHLIAELRTQHRCVAADHIGFGLSSRSDQNHDHHPNAHAARFESFVLELDLRDLTLYVNDWGGPIGLDFARKHPDRVKNLIIANTWCWPVSSDRHFRFFSSLMASRLGQYLIARRTYFVKGVMPRAVADRKTLTPEVMAHYLNALPDPRSRAACAALPGFIVGASEWLESIWNDRAAFTGKPTLLLWGSKDIAFRLKELEQWKSEMSQFEAHVFDDCGHFVAEEVPQRALPLIRDLLRK